VGPLQFDPLASRNLIALFIPFLHAEEDPLILAKRKGGHWFEEDIPQIKGYIAAESEY
jgi:hypothetical protein